MLPDLLTPPPLTFIPRQYQIDALAGVENYFRNKLGTHPIVIAPQGCHALGHPIIMYDGTIKTVENIAIGDVVMGDDGTPRHVVKLYRGREMMYRIIPVKGEPFVVNASHRLALKFSNTGKKYPEYKDNHVFDYPMVSDFIKKSNNYKRHHLLYRASQIEFAYNNSSDVPIDPWVLGALIGDGSFVSGTPSICTPDREIIDHLKQWANENGLMLSFYEKKQALGYNINITDPTSNRSRKNKLRIALEDIGLWGASSGEKFVPQQYKIGSTHLRKEILAGLLDTDGHQQNSGYDYISKSQQLADDICFISRSLGLAAYKKECVKGCQNEFSGTYWRVSISGDTDIIPCRVERKKSLPRQQKKSVLVTGFSVEPVGEGDFYGFELDRNHLYLDGSFTVHHNSGKSSMIAMLIQRIMKLDRRVICLASDKRLIEQNYKEMQGIWPDAPMGIYCAGLNRKDTHPPIIYATIQSVINNPDALGMFHYAIIDECDLLSPDDDTQYRKYIDYLMGWYPSLRVIGHTATPYRMNQGYLWEGEGALFDGVAYSISIKRLLDEGYLCPLVPYQRKGMDTSKLLIAQGEFDIASQVESLADMLPMIADDIVASFKGDNRKKLLAFTPNVETAIDMACLLSERGLLCDHLTSKRTKDEQSSIIEGFKLGSFPALVSVNMVMRGFNVPDIDCVANVRAMTSPAIYEQGAGRGMRIHPSKVNTLYLDYGGNIRRHGVITNVIPPRKRDARQIKMDEELNVWESMRHCDACGRVYEPPFPETCECGEVMIVPRKPNVNEYSATDDGKDPMKEEPVWHDVEWTRYDRHIKENGTDSMVVEYNVVGHTYPFKEWICFEHQGYAREKATSWWKTNTTPGTPIPSTISDALAMVDDGELPETSKIQVVREGKYWRVLQRVNKLDLGADEGLLL